MQKFELISPRKNYLQVFKFMNKYFYMLDFSSCPTYSIIAFEFIRGKSDWGVNLSAKHPVIL